MLINKIQFPNLNYINFGKQNASNISPKLNTPLQNDVFIKSANNTNPIYFTGTKKPSHPDYSDTEKFSKYLDKKITNDLCDPKEQDIKKTINNISKKAEISKKDAVEIVSRLTQFSNYSQLENLEDALVKHSISHLDTILPYNSQYFGINNVIDYLSDKKRQLHFSHSDEKGAVFLDKPTLKFIKEHKKLCQRLYERVYKNTASLVVVDGWQAEASGKKLSYGLFGGPLSLEDAAVEIGKEIKKGKSLDDVLNGEIIKEAKDVFGENVEVEVLKNKKSKPTIEGITEQMQSLRPDREMIKDMLDAILKSAIEDGEISKQDENKARMLLAQYFDEMMNCFSSKSMTDILKEKYKQIEKFVTEKGKTMDDVIYIVPNKTKSFGLVTYQYANVNNVDFSQIQLHDCDDFYCDADVDDKIFVILDDVVGSGSSVIYQHFPYSKFVNISGIKGDRDIIFSPISALKQGVDKIKNYTSEQRCNNGKDIIQPHIVVDYKKLQKKIGDKNLALLSKVLRYPGYKEGFACTAMPYAIPDNCTSASGFLLNPFLNDTDGNNSDYFNYGYMVYMPNKYKNYDFFDDCK